MALLPNSSTSNEDHYEWSLFRKFTMTSLLTFKPDKGGYCRSLFYGSTYFKMPIKVDFLLNVLKSRKRVPDKIWHGREMPESSR